MIKFLASMHLNFLGEAWQKCVIHETMAKKSVTCTKAMRFIYIFFARKKLVAFDLVCCYQMEFGYFSAFPSEEIKKLW